MFGRLTPVVKILLIINIALLLIPSLLKFDISNGFGLYNFYYSDHFRPYQIFTHMFLHASSWHLFSNMFGLFIFGPLLERFWGQNKFIIFYLVCGIGASLLYTGISTYELGQMKEETMLYQQDPSPSEFALFAKDNAPGYYNQLLDFIDQYRSNPENENMVAQSVSYVSDIFDANANIPMIGASGALFGILMAFGMLFPNTELMLLFLPVPIKAKYFVAIYGLFELYSGIKNAPGDSVAHFAHIGGMLFAFILIKIWQGQRKDFY